MFLIADPAQSMVDAPVPCTALYSESDEQFSGHYAEQLVQRVGLDLVETAIGDAVYSSEIMLRFFYRRLNGIFKRYLLARSLKYNPIFLRFFQSLSFKSPRLCLV